MGIGHRNTAQNNLQLAEGWTSPKAEASSLSRPPEGTRPLAWSLAGVKGAAGPQRGPSRKLWSLIGERQSRVGMRLGSPP